MIDEAFLTNAQVAAAFPGVSEDEIAKITTTLLIGLRGGPDDWPSALPKDFDHVLLRRLGFPCGQDEAREHYALCEEPGGWRIWKVRDLVEATVPK